MKKIAIMLVLLAFASTTFAAVKALEGYSNTATYYQFTHDDLNNTGDYTDHRRSDQNWLGAQMIYLHIDYESDVWVSNYIRSWEENVAALDGNIFQMGATQYGAIEVDGDRVWEGTGDHRTVTYNRFDANNVEHLHTTEAYYVGHFEGGETVALYMTTLPIDGSEKISAMQYVNDPAQNHYSMLASREDGTIDAADNVRINFSLSTGAREFVAFGVGGENPPAPSGQPLPGVLSTIIVACCSIACAKKMKKNK